MNKIILEPILGSLGILIAGFATIPLVGKLAGADISMSQGLVMGLVFFILRFFWLLVLRLTFSKK